MSGRGTQKAKVCLVGDQGVGKTSLVRRFVQGEFSEDYLPTLGAAFSKRSVEVPAPGGPRALDLIIWDIVGRLDFVDLVGDAYFQFANGVVAVCDATRRDTFGALASWIDRARAAAGTVPVLILANKWDLQGALEVSREELEALGRETKAEVLATSAKTGQNVEEGFNRMARAIVARATGAHPTGV